VQSGFGGGDNEGSVVPRGSSGGPEIGAPASHPHCRAGSMGGTEGRAPYLERARDLASMEILNII
jgi:hypothetical protein